MTIFASRTAQLNAMEGGAPDGYYKTLCAIDLPGAPVATAGPESNVWCAQGPDTVTLHFDVGGSQATWGEVLEELLGTNAGCTHWNAVLAACPFEAFYLEMPPLCRSTRDLTFQMCAVRAAPEQVARWNERLDRDTFPVVRGGRGSPAPVAEWNGGMGRGRGPWLVSPGDPGGEVVGGHGIPIAACRSIASFVRDARPEQQQALWHRVGLELQGRAADDRPTWVSTDGRTVHWLHVRLSYRPQHYKHEPYTHDPGGGGGGRGGGGGGAAEGQPVVSAAGAASGSGDKTLPCRECGQTFVFSVDERAWFEQQGYQPPKTCKPCRDRRRRS